VAASASSDPAPPASPGVNRLSLSGSIQERSALRYTPAGLPALDLVVDHLSTVQEEGVPRKVSMACKAVCIGTVAVSAQTVSLGQPMVFHGFLAGARNGRGLIFHITDLRPAAVPESDSEPVPELRSL